MKNDNENLVTAEPKIRKGMIVTVRNGNAGGNSIGSTVKVLSAPSEVNDRLFAILGKRTHENLEGQILCERTGKFGQNMKFGATHNNIPCFYEYISDLRPATTFEKKRRQERIKNDN